MDRELFEIVCHAATLAERSGPDFIADPNGSGLGEANRQLEQWCRIVADGDWSLFERRLALDSLTVEAARRALLPVRLRPGAQLPAWTRTLTDVLLAAKDSRQSSDRSIEAGRPLPFQEVCLPFVQVAGTRLRDRAGVAYDRFHEDAHRTLERELLAQLSVLSAQTLYLEFSIFQGWRASGLARFFSDTSLQNYVDFVDELLGGKLVTFFREYSVLARRMSTAADVWVSATAELLRRVENDQHALRTAFGNGSELGRVRTIRPNLSDPHGEGRTVAVLTWETGLKLVYKPRDLSLERAYNELLEWLNAHGAPLPLRVCRILERPGYGWMEFVDRRSCASLQEANRYFRRAGMHLCLVYALRGADFHDENVIAAGEDPVLVDLEVLMQPRLREPIRGVTGPDDPAHQEIGESVLSSGLMPWWLVMPDGRSLNLAGLGAGEDAEYPYRIPQWRNVNSDAMELAREYKTVRPEQNIATLTDETLSPVRFEQQLVDGFREMYRILLDQRETLLAPGGPLATFAHLPIRFILRPTNLYGWYLERSLAPQFLRDGIAPSLCLDTLSRELVRSSSLWSLFEAEKQALERMDVPRFVVRSDSDSLLGDDYAAEHCFLETGYELAEQHIRQMSEDDLQWQIQMMRGALHAYGTEEVAHVAADRSAATVGEATTTLTAEEAVRQALRLARTLERRALRSESGASWIGLMPIPPTRRLQFQPVWYGLYEGACGIALFLAALEKTTNGSGYRDLCLAALEPFRASLRISRDHDLPYIGPHGELGAVIYALVRIGALLNEPALHDDARRLAGFVTAERIAGDRQFDVVAGNAGTILGLLALHEATAEDHLMSRAMACGRHLLEQREPSAAGLRSWRTIDRQLLAGFSHGAAGIAYALLRLGRATGDRSFTDAALEAIRYEQTLFDPNRGNWPRLGEGGSGPTFQSSWCHGAPGIGLARVAALEIADTPSIRADIDAAIGTTQRTSLAGVDHVCCGNFGRLEFLLMAGQTLGREDLVVEARQRAADVVARAATRGRFVFRGSEHDLSAELSPGFFQGEAGIGYELLRLANPEQVPSVLAFE